jgi:hypothetical protein
VGDPDLSGQEPSSERAADPTGRGLVVFPPRAQPRRQRPLARYAPFLITVALGAILVLVVALVR